MKKSKIIKKIIITLLILFPFYIKASESYGQLRYEITDLSINDSNITISGWAFIYETQNTKENTEIYIRAIGNKNSKVYAETENSVASESSKCGKNSGQCTWNFFEEMYWEYLNGNNQWPIEKQLSTVYSGGSFTIDWGKGNSTKWDNTCNYSKEDTNLSTQCYYENIAFTATFDVSEWDIANTEEIVLQLKMKNSSVESEWTSLGITNNAMPRSVNSDYIEIKEGTVSSKVKSMVTDGRFTDKNNNLIETNNHYIIMNQSENYTLATIHNEIIYKSPEDNYVPQGTKSSGKYAVYVNTTPTSKYEYNPASSGDYLYVSTSWVRPSGVLILNVSSLKKCPVSSQNKENLNCNELKDLESNCDILTIKSEENASKKVRANVKLNQSGIITSVLTPTETFSGGGFKFNIIYSNVIEYEVLSRKENTSDSDIENLMNKKIYTPREFIDRIDITNIYFDNKIFDEKFIKECKVDEKFKNRKLRTTCVFSLPKAILNDFDGKIKKYESTGNIDFNNEFYTPMNFNGNYSISAVIKGMSRLNEDVAKDDTKEINKKWIGDWNNYTFKNCNIKLHELGMTEIRKKMLYKFIYRPIDINNPFPNRNAGFNWYDWINDDNNKERLANSYNKMQYSIKLDYENIKKIKAYNRGKNYLDWDSIDKSNNNKSSFVTEFFDADERRKNIIDGDNS